MHACLLSDGYPPWDRGGAQRVAAQVAEGYRDRGLDVSVVTTVADPDDAGRDTVDGIAVHRLHAPHPERLLPYLTTYNPFVAREMKRTLDRLDSDVVHAHNVHWLSDASLRAAAARDLPVVKTYHDAGTFAYGEFTGFLDDVGATGDVTDPDKTYRASPLRQLREQGLRYNPARNWLKRRALRRSVDAGVAVSDDLRAALSANAVPCHETIRNGIDVGAFDATAGGEASFRRARGLGDAPFVLFGGRTGYTKGGSHLATAFARLRSRTDRDVHLVVTGDDGYVDRMRGFAGPHGGRIVTTGWLPRAELLAGLRAATVVATPSVHLDPFPTVNLEAFAAATPVVTTCFGGATELVDDGEDGLVVDPRNEAALASALAWFVDDPSRAAACGAAGREKVARRFTVDRQVDAYLDVLDRVVSGG